MIEIGQLLRQTRESKQLTLADVEAETRIRQRYLNALESGNWDDLPNPVAARGFLRRYATFLGLDPEELVGQIDVQDASTPGDERVESGKSQEVSEYKPIDLDLYGATTRRPRLLRQIFGLLVVVIPLAALAYLLFLYGVPYVRDRTQSEAELTTPIALPPAGSSPTVPVIGPTDTPVEMPELASPAPTNTPPPAPTDTPTPLPSPTLTATPVESIRLRVVVTNTAWLRIVTDGEIQVESLVDPGFDQEFVAHEQLEFLTGNAGGVQLTLDGTPMPPLGEIGEISVFVWTVRDGQVVEITPTPIPTEAPTATAPPEQTPEDVNAPAPTATPTP